MNETSRRVNGWAQSSLLPPEHVRIEITVHLTSGAPTARVGVHVSDHGTGDTLGIFTEDVPCDRETDAVVASAIDLLSGALREHWYPY